MFQKFSAYTREYTYNGNKEKIKALSEDFLAHKISAAGLSYTITEKSRVRRYLWLFLVVGCVTFMGYMTLNVVQEYLSYPKMLIKEDDIMSRLPFPAVTICSLNPISEKKANQTTLRKHVKLKSFFNSIKSTQSRHRTKNICMEEPLCQWSWFLEYCECMKNPCYTEYCLPNNDTHCICSSSVCNDKKFACSIVENATSPWTKNLCICDNVDTHETDMKQPDKGNLTDILLKIEDGELQSLIQLIWNSNTFDLTDVDEALMPTMQEIYDHGITFDSLVASCSFEQDNCYRDNFTLFYHPKYGKCYMFNYAGKSDSPPVMQPIETNNYGSNSGLKLLLRVSDQEEVLDLVRREVGARIVIHDPYSLPFVAEYGVNVRPDDMAAVAVTMSIMSRLPAPWGNCVDPERNGFNKEPYSILGCEKQCGFQYMTRKCNCTMRNLMHGSVLSNNWTSYPVCNLTVTAEKECVSKAAEEVERRMVNCDCRPPCNETVYSYTVTSSELNADYFRMIKAIRTMSVDPDGDLNYINANDHKSMIGVKVYYNTFQVSKDSEVKSYSWETLIANVGGNLGFFMGLTLITFLEILEFVWDLLSTMCRKPQENKVYTVPNALRVFSRTRQETVGDTNLRRRSV